MNSTLKVSNRHNSYVKMCLKLSNSSKCRCQHAAILVSAGRVLSVGFNSYKTHPTWGSGPLKTLHAEAAAIRRAVSRGIDVRGSTIFVVRNNKGQGGRMSKPCNGCQTIIEQYGISKIVYTDETGAVIEEWPPLEALHSRHAR